jgi:hypothetical protein
MTLRRCAAAIICTVAPLLAACFQSSTLVKLNPDGSGTLEQTTTMTAQALQQLQSLASIGDKDKKSQNPVDPFSVDEAKKQAARMGAGVTFVSAQKIDTPERKGMRAVYAFSDVRKLAVSEMNAPGGADMGQKPQQPVTMTFTQLPNGHAVLTLKNDADVAKNLKMPGTGDAGQPAVGADNPQAAEMMKQMLGGMKIDFAIQVGHIVKTNIPYVNGGTVTVLSMDFDQMLANPAGFEKLQRAKTPAETKAALQGVKGIKLSLDPELTVEFTK